MLGTGWEVHAVWMDAMQGSSRFAYDILLHMVRSISDRWKIVLKAEETKTFRALVVTFVMMTRTASAHMQAHALARGLVYGTGILIVIDALDAIAQVLFHVKQICIFLCTCSGFYRRAPATYCRH
jgi:hypothetical protein